MADPIRVLRIINRFNLGGPTYNAALLTKHLAPKYDTLLLGGEKDDSEDSSAFILESLGLEPKYVPGMRREINFKADRAAHRFLCEQIRTFKPQIVHTHASKAGAIGRLAARKMKVPVIVHTFHGHVFHSYFGKMKTSFYKGVERYLAKRSSQIVAISDIQKRELTEQHKICPADKVSVINLGFDLSRFTERQGELRKSFRSQYQLTDDEVALGIVGRLVPIKDHSFFLRAVARIKTRVNKPVRAFIVGDGELKQALIAETQELGLSVSESPEQVADIHFTSWIKDVERVNAGIDIMCLTSKNEGTPVTLIEAQASSLPIVSTNVGGIEDIVLKDETAFLSQSGDLDGFSQYLAQVIDNNDLRVSMREKGRDHALSRFNYTRLAQDMDDLYQRLLHTQSR